MDVKVEAQHPYAHDANAENFQCALAHLGVVHALEVGALQRENNWLRLQVGQLRSSLKSITMGKEGAIEQVGAHALQHSMSDDIWFRSEEADGCANWGLATEDGGPRLLRAQECPSFQSLNKHDVITREDQAPKEVLDKIEEIKAETAMIERAHRRHSGKKNSKPNREDVPPGSLQAKLLCFVESAVFDCACASMIILNSVLIGYSVELKTIDYNKEVPYLEQSGHLFSLFFLIELSLRMAAQGKYYFHSDNRPWNFFDIVLVAYSVVDFIMFNTEINTQSGFHSNMKTVKMFRILRVFRVFRFCRELSMLALMIVDSIRSLIWALIMLAVIIYVFAIFFTQGATDYKQEKGVDADPDVDKWFGSLLRTIYSLVLSMLGGVSWYEVSDPLLVIHWTQVALFFFYITFTILAVLNIITGVFVDNAVETAGTQREFLVQKEMEIKEKYVKEMHDFFMEMDQDSSGTVTLDEVKEYFEDLRVQSYFQALGIDPQDTERLFHLIDDDGSGEISVDEFLDGCLRLKGSARSIDVHALMYECKRLQTRQDEMLRLLGVDPHAKSLMHSGKKRKAKSSEASHQTSRHHRASFCESTSSDEASGHPHQIKGAKGPGEAGVEIEERPGKLPVHRNGGAVVPSPCFPHSRQDYEDCMSW